MKRLKNWQELNKKEKAIRVLTIWMIVIVPLYAIMQSLPQCDSLLYSIFNIIVRFFYAPWIFFPFIIWGLNKKNKKERKELVRIMRLKERYEEYEKYYFNENKRDIASSKVLDSHNKVKGEIIKENAQDLVGMDYIYVDQEGGWDYITYFTKKIKVVKGRINTLFWDNWVTEKLYAPKERIFLLALDTNIVSYIKRYMDGKLEKQFYPIIKTLKRCKGKNIEINIDSYILENCILDLEINEVQSENIMQAYYFIYGINYTRKIAKQKAADTVEKLKNDFKQIPHDLAKKQERYSYAYCVLLKIIILKFQKGALKEKTLNLINFMNEVTCTLDPAFANLAYAYWEKGEKIRFFGTIQRNRKDILKQIRNMAWDIYHLFNTSLSYQKENDLSRLYYPVFYTNDNRLADIGEDLKLQGVAIDNIKNLVVPHYTESVWKKILTIREQYNYLGYDKLRKRNAKRKEVDTIALCKELEKELLEVLNQ